MKIEGKHTTIESANNVHLTYVTPRYTAIDAFWIAFGVTHGAIIAVASALLVTQAWPIIRPFVIGAP